PVHLPRLDAQTDAAHGRDLGAVEQAVDVGLGDVLKVRDGAARHDDLRSQLKGPDLASKLAHRAGEGQTVRVFRTGKLLPTCRQFRKDGRRRPCAVAPEPRKRALSNSPGIVWAMRIISFDFRL